MTRTMKKPILVKLEPEYIGLLRSYRAHHHVSVNFIVNTAVERYLTMLYSCKPGELSYMAYTFDNSKYLPED